MIMIHSIICKSCGYVVLYLCRPYSLSDGYSVHDTRIWSQSKSRFDPMRAGRCNGRSYLIDDAPISSAPQIFYGKVSVGPNAV